ncbi:SIR2 family protein [Marinicella sediminis]|uniref:SIR2 family protein n=1 Tax=Marinicella sediminis TaxID=1792834 RepID=A0ABV7JA76_9GAMM|nr:SIR2 family protein [Marinicella sediminis]
MDDPEKKDDKITPIPELPFEVKKAAENGKLVLFVGAGASMLLGMPSWNELAEKVLKCLRLEGEIDYAELNQLKNLDAKKQLSIAYTLADKKIDLDLPQYLVRTKDSNIYRYLNSIGSVYVTTNYDHELNPQNSSPSSDQAIQTVDRISDPNDFNTALLKNPGTVIHLHGDMLNPNEMIVTTRQYLAHYDHPNVINFLAKLFKEYTVLFVGYSLEEAEILEHILRRGNAREEGKDTNGLKRFLLQGYFESEQPLYEKLVTYYRKSFGVNLKGFSKDKEDYCQLEKIIKDWSEQIEVLPPPTIDDIAEIDRVVVDE